MKQIYNYVNKNKIIIILFLLSIFFGLFWNHRSYFKPIPSGGDQRQYTCVAQDLLNKHTYTKCGEESNLEPFYPTFLAVIFKFTNYNPDAVRFAQLFLYGFISVLIYLLGKKLFNKKVGLLAGLFSSIFWVFANFTGEILREIILIFLILVLVYFLYLASIEKNNKYFILSGVFLGLLTLTNAITQYLIIFIVLNFIFILRKELEFKKVLLKLGIFIISFIIIISPWVIRNSIKNSTGGAAMVPRSGQMLLFRAYYMEKLYPDMYKFYFGHLAGYYFAEKLFSDLDILAFRNADGANLRRDVLREQGMSLSEVDKILTKESVIKIIEQPHKYALMSILDFFAFNSPIVPQRIFGGNTYAYFTFAEERHSEIPEFIKVIVLITFRLFWYSFLFLAAYGLFKNIKYWKKISWMFIIILYFNGVYSAVFAIPRYAVQIYPFYIILASLGFFLLYDKYHMRLKNVFNFFK